MPLIPSSPSSIASRLSEPPCTTTASTPPPEDDCAYSEDNNGQESFIFNENARKDIESKYKALKAVLEKSEAYSMILRENIEQTREAQRKKASEEVPLSSRRGKKRSPATLSHNDEPPAKKKRKLQQGKTEESSPPKTEDGLESKEEHSSFPQPRLVSGARLKPYQLEGLQWMACLHSNGISGILADEMGLGKTLQTIAFSAYLRELSYQQAFLVVCPLSVLNNWVEEYAKFAPEIPVCMYHGTPEERADLRRTELLGIPKSTQANTKDVSQAVPAKTSARRTGKGRKKPRKSTTRTAKGKRVSEDDQVMDEAQDNEEDVESPSFPVVITTYEMIMKDRVHLASYNWGYIVVDEGHRLKNIDSKLMREIKKYNNASRMILTGTPLHNNLSELWALLNFVLPDIFTDLDQFEEWFNLPNMKATIGEQRSTEIIDTLHTILKPFLLRRLKVDVAIDLPPKKEYVLYAPLSVTQREAYSKVLDGKLRSFLIGKMPSSPGKEASTSNERRKLRSQAATSHVHALEEDDDKYFDMLEHGDVNEKASKTDDISALAKQHEYKNTTKRVNNMKLQNTVMQLRKVCSHPYLFDWPLDPRTRQPILDDRVVSTSGKMMILERLLDELFRRKHKVLIFSQFTTMLDIIDDWARELKGWDLCRIDGSTPHLDRKAAMERFQNRHEALDAPSLFLLSTRAGGLGINLTAADTVIFYDQDWNPQMDAQAQDRAHRIGQTKPVLIFRIVSAHTIETKIMERATEKKQLEAVVIAKGKFSAPIAGVGSANFGPAESTASLLGLDEDKVVVVEETGESVASVISDQDLDALLDRSPSVFTSRQKGWTSAQEVGPAQRAAFAVYGGVPAGVDDPLATMLNRSDDD